MPQFIQELNQDALGIRTSARYDANAATWLADVANYVQNGSGIWVPVGDANPMPIKATVLGTTGDAAVIDPALAATIDALLKGIIKQLQGDGTAGKAAPVKNTNYYLAIGASSAEAEKTATATAVAVMAGGTPLTGRKTVMVANPLSNTQAIRCGSTTNTIDELWPGDSITYPVEPGTVIYIKSSAADQPYRTREAA